MSSRSRREYIETQRARYRRGTRKQKGWILDEGCRMFGVHRKSLIRAFGGRGQRGPRRRGRPRHYGAELLRPLKVISRLTRSPIAASRWRARSFGP